METKRAPKMVLKTVRNQSFTFQSPAPTVLKLRDRTKSEKVMIREPCRSDSSFAQRESIEVPTVTIV